MEQIYKYKIADTTIVFSELSGKRLRLIHFSPEPFFADRHIPEELLEASAIVELQITGVNQPDHKGNKLGNTLIGRELVAKNIHCEGNKITIIQFFQSEEIYLEVETVIDGSLQENMFVWRSKVKNLGETIGIEYITSLNIAAINDSFIHHPFIEDRLHLPTNSWQGELQWKNARLNELGLYYGLDGEGLQDSTKYIGITNQTSWSCAQYSPFGLLENEKNNRISFWQIENNGEWHWELSDCGFGKYLVLRAGGPTEPTNHWWKKLKKNEQFETVPVAYGTIFGRYSEAIELLNEYRRSIRRENEDNQTCPVIFNDYMNSLMGDPTTEKELPMIEKAAEVGCEYYVIDCGWYSDGYWWDNVGEWKPSKQRFPEGLAFLTQRILDKGMVPGLWLEIEVMGINSELANSLPDEWFICRHGKRIKDHSRYHLDFRNSEVQAYATAVVDRLISEFKIGYIKMDYNTPTAGSDVDADSYSDALLSHNRAYLAWVDRLFKKYPKLVIENCGSGGMRHDYAMLSRHSIQSITDQTNYLRNGAIAAIAATGVTPEQSAVWSYPLKEGDTEEVIFNMVNTMLLRIHQSGHLAELNNQRVSLVKEGIDVYKSIRQYIPFGKPRWYTGLPTLDDEWFSFALETPTDIYIAVWRTKSLDCQFSVSLPMDVNEVQQLYPKKELGSANFFFNKNQLIVEYSKDKMARLYKIKK